MSCILIFFFFSSRRRHTRYIGDWSSDVCSSDLRGATMQLDLLERPGKYQNGFCHGPVPAWINEKGEWVPGQINFTAEATPDQVGSGIRAINTLFHEGGHEIGRASCRERVEMRVR